LKLSHLELPRPTRWDLLALAVVGLAASACAANLWVASRKPVGAAMPNGVTALFVVLQLAVSTAALGVLGKTAKEGTLWGILLAIGGILAAVSGVLLAAALWAAA